MELPFDTWNRIFEQCDSFKEKKKLYDALPDSFRIQYPKFIVPDSDKCLLKDFLIDDEKEVIFSLKICGHYLDNSNPILFKENSMFIKNKCIESSFRYKHVPKTLNELFDFDIKIYEYYQSILEYNLYKISKGLKTNYTQMNIEYKLKIEDCEICIKTAVIPFIYDFDIYKH